MIVVDASAMLEALLRTPAAPAVERRLFDPAETLHAPYLLDIDIVRAVARNDDRSDVRSSQLSGAN
jgi:predicted nucleic acid-binding protein